MYTHTYWEVNLQLYMRLCLQFNHSTRFITQIPWQDILKVCWSPPEEGKPHFLSYMDRVDSAMWYGPDTHTNNVACTYNVYLQCVMYKRMLVYHCLPCTVRGQAVYVCVWVCVCVCVCECVCANAFMCVSVCVCVCGSHSASLVVIPSKVQKLFKYDNKKI